MTVAEAEEILIDYCEENPGPETELAAGYIRMIPDLEEIWRQRGADKGHKVAIHYACRALKSWDHEAKYILRAWADGKTLPMKNTTVGKQISLF